MYYFEWWRVSKRLSKYTCNNVCTTVFKGNQYLKQANVVKHVKEILFSEFYECKIFGLAKAESTKFFFPLAAESGWDFLICKIFAVCITYMLYTQHTQVTEACIYCFWCFESLCPCLTCIIYFILFVLTCIMPVACDVIF